MTQKEVAEVLGVSPQYVAKVEASILGRQRQNEKLEDRRKLVVPQVDKRTIEIST